MSNKKYWLCSGCKDCVRELKIIAGLVEDGYNVDFYLVEDGDYCHIVRSKGICDRGKDEK